jgi:transcriptional regulator of arginine metabolism
MKAFRQGQILRIVQDKQIHTQDELARELAGLGIQATQVTLSRDIRELGLVKTKDGYTRLQNQPERAQLESAVVDYLLDIRTAQNVIVLKTAAAHANSLAIALDRSDWPEIVGTIAGDDTVMVVSGDAGSAQRFKEKLLEILQQPES